MEVFHFAGDFKVVGSEWKSESPEHGCDMAEPPDDELQEGVVKCGSCRLMEEGGGPMHTYVHPCFCIIILST